MGYILPSTSFCLITDWDGRKLIECVNKCIISVENPHGEAPDWFSTLWHHKSFSALPFSANSIVPFGKLTPHGHKVTEAIHIFSLSWSMIYSKVHKSTLMWLILRSRYRMLLASQKGTCRVQPEAPTLYVSKTQQKNFSFNFQKGENPRLDSGRLWGWGAKGAEFAQEGSVNYSQDSMVIMNQDSVGNCGDLYCGHWRALSSHTAQFQLISTLWHYEPSVARLSSFSREVANLDYLKSLNC